ncbi:uncharacterized protein GIQ15_03120 [Arthroderma uncinatum]|uniref:uncharacterized protein n=1 Tax=Arthroderma uncinatum TaxID=74035 RepID=UPI00144AD452|nr:uncharacterized protein GIQ15_03120 [Arthroderma uncinatum]KAF3483796.1 hypothetical protein GIQ15_03120 [Arthroderma uncinatum]
MISDADNFAELAVQEEQVRRDQGSPSPGARNRRTLDRKTENIYGMDLDFLDDVSDDDLRMKLAQHALDERRLKRVTNSSNGPIFSRAKDTDLRTALSMENLQRHHEAEAQGREQEVQEPDNHVEPALNVPKTWGTRGRRSREWLDGVVPTTNDDNNNQAEDPIRLPVNEWDNDFDFTARSLQVSDSPPVKVSSGKEDAGSMTQFPKTAAQEDYVENIAQRDAARPDLRPDTASSAFSYRPSEKARPTSRGNSTQLLRKLTRRSSSPVNTPEQQRTAMKTPLTAKTPVVTGAWIDTPLTERTKAPHIETIKKEQQSPAAKLKPTESISKAGKASEPVTRDLSKRQSPPQRKPSTRLVQLKEPKLPKSALESVLEKGKSGDYSLILGENTLDSLKDLLEDKSTSAETEEGQTKSEPGLSSLHVDTDEETIDRVNSKLKSLLHNINEARAGLSSLEHQAEETISRPHAEGSKNKRPKIQKHQHSSSSCEACGLYGDGRLYLALPSRRFWKRVGWALLIFFTWWIAEFLMCDYYCHPLYAVKCERNCLNPNAPRYPFVIPTMLWRWSHLSTVLSPIWTIFVALFRFMAQLFGFWDGFVDGPSSIYDQHPYYQPPVSTVYQQSAGLYSQSDSMQGDEYL